MENAFDPPDSTGQGHGIGQIADHHLAPRNQIWSKPLPISHQQPEMPTLAEQALRQVTANEAGRARH
jgi:hypothetical protein